MSTELPEMPESPHIYEGAMAHDWERYYTERYFAILARLRALDELWDEYADILADDPGEARDTLLLDVGNRLDELRDRLRKEGTLP